MSSCAHKRYNLDIMTSTIFAGLLLLIAIAAVVIRKTYFVIPIVELRRRARAGDELAEQLYKSAVYDGSLSVLLWFVITFSSAASFVLLAQQAPTWMSLLTVVIALWLAFTWLPKSRVTTLGNRLTVLVTPSISWLLNYLHPILSRGSALASRRYVKPHTGLYERSDLIELIERQEVQPDNRLASEELDIAKHALSFPRKKVADVMTPRKLIKTINADDTIGPILIDELHKSGQSVALVRETTKGPIIGSLQLKALNLASSGKVRDVMENTICYVNENDSLGEALQAFFTTDHSLFVVVNNAEENVGIITVKTVLEKLLGQVSSDDFDQYSNISAVAGKHHKPKTLKTDDGIDETVEI